MDDVSVTIEAGGESEEILVPETLIERLDQADEGPTTVVADVAAMGLAGRVHALVHHAEDAPDEELAVAEEQMMDRFEERFGVSYGEATGHSH